MSAADQPVVLISGGSRGLGLAIVEDCLAHAWRVVTFSRAGSDRIGELERSEPDRLLHVTADLADLDAPRRVVAAARERFGRLDALVNNAAVAVEGMLAMTPNERIEEVIRTNLVATTILSKECIREFLKAPRSRRRTIVNVSSVVGLTGFRGLGVYSATKSALLGLTRSLARELGAANVRVNAILPGYLETDMSIGLDPDERSQIVRRTPLGRLGTTSDVIPVVRFLLGPGSGFMTGQSIVVDGGATC